VKIIIIKLLSNTKQLSGKLP